MLSSLADHPRRLPTTHAHSLIQLLSSNTAVRHFPPANWHRCSGLSGPDLTKHPGANTCPTFEVRCTRDSLKQRAELGRVSPSSGDYWVCGPSPRGHGGAALVSDDRELYILGNWVWSRLIGCGTLCFGYGLLWDLTRLV